MSAFIVLQQMLVLFAMMAIGYILWKFIGWMRIPVKGYPNWW